VTEEPAAPDATGGYLDALAVGEFGALFATYTVSMLGDIVAAVALTVLVFQRTVAIVIAAVTGLAIVAVLAPGVRRPAPPDRAVSAAALL
jgi:hypothetical protein